MTSGTASLKNAVGNQLRSFNPHLKEHFKTSNIPRIQYGFRNIVRPSVCQEIIDKLNLREKYPNAESSLDIVDIFPGYGLFSTMVNHELQPKKHVVIDNNSMISGIWKDRINFLNEKTGNKENFVLYEKDGYTWETYDQLIKEDKIIEPKIIPRTSINDELLIIANLSTTKFGESLLAQWLACCGYGNWLQKYGRVRMLCFTQESTGQKFMSQEKFSKRNKASIKRDTFTESNIVGISEAQEVYDPPGSGYDPNAIIRDQPVIFPGKSILPPSSSLTLLEVVPKNIDKIDIDVDMYEFFLKLFLYRKTSKVEEALKYIGPGADKDIVPKLREELRTKVIRDLNVEEVLEIYGEFDKWPFRPTYEETIDVIDFEDRRI